MAIKEIVFNGRVFKLSYLIQNSDAKKDILFLHGWGMNKNLMKSAFSKYFSSYRHIYVDLPGFGNSDINVEIKSSFMYSEILQIFCNKINFKYDCIVGHSFGGKLGALLNPLNLILLSSAGIPKKKSLIIKLKILTTKVLNRLKINIFKTFLRSKDADNLDEYMYKTFKNVVDEDFSDIFKKFENKSIIFWGKEDNITPLSSAELIHKYIKNSKLHIYEGDHFFFLNNVRKIERSILDEFSN